LENTTARKLKLITQLDVVKPINWWWWWW